MPSVQQLEALLQDNPEDTFLQYALAMELGNCGQHDRSLEIFRRLMEQEPPYVPAYFMAGQQLARLGRIEESRQTLTLGIDQAAAQNDQHAAGEMSDFLASLHD